MNSAKADIKDAPCQRVSNYLWKDAPDEKNGRIVYTAECAWSLVLLMK